MKGLGHRAEWPCRVGDLGAPLGQRPMPGTKLLLRGPMQEAQLFLSSRRGIPCLC